MEKEFLDGLAQHKPVFRAEPWFNRWGDCIEFQMVDEAIVAHRVDEMLTVYNSAIDDRPIGFQIKDVTAILRKLGCESLVLASKTDPKGLEIVSISVLLLAAYEEGPKTVDRRKGYGAAATLPMEGKGVPASEIQLSARGE